MIGNVIFDLDGTLVDSAAVCADILSRMLHERGSSQTITQADAIPFLSRGGTHMVSGLLGAECRDPEAEIADFRARYAEWRTPANSLYEGVGTGLRELAADGLKLAICSNKPQNLCDKVIADLGLSSVFSAVVGGAPDRRAKPHPELMERTLGQLRAEPRQCIYVGDSEIDHMVAKTVGIPFLFVSYGYADEAWDRSGVSQFSHFAEIVEAIRDLRRASRVERRAA